MNSKKIIILSVIVVLCFSQNRLSLTSAFAASSGFSFNRVLPQKPQVFVYSHAARVAVESGEATKQEGVYQVNIFPHPKLSTADSITYVGWVDQYVGQDGRQTLGFSNPQLKSKPVFTLTENIRTGTIDKVKVPSALGSDFLNLITSLPEQFSPSFSETEKNAISRDENTGEVVIQSAQSESSVTDGGKLYRRIQLDSQSFVVGNEIEYTFTLSPVSSAQAADAQIRFEGGDQLYTTTANTRFALEKRTEPDEGLINKVLETLESDPTTTEYSPAQLQRIINEKFNAQVQANAQANTDAGNQTDITQIKRTLQSVYPIYNKIINLINQNVLGKTLKVSVEIICSIKVYNKNPKNTSNSVTCAADLWLSYGSANKKIHLADFTKIFNINWSQNANFGGSWGVGIVIPLPPPVSFIQISLSFKIGYSIGVGAYVNLTANVLTAGVSAQAAVTATAEAGVRVLIAEGGVYLQGTIVSLKTEPKLTLTLGLNTIYANLNWTLKLNAFSFKWGLYYKWCYIFGCGSRHNITTWTVTQGVTSTWTIYSKSFTIYL